MKALNKEIFRLAIPSILANLTVPLVGMVDIAVAGHLDSSAAALIGGISVGSLMFDMMYWNFGFLRAGTGGLTAQAFGRGDWHGCGVNLKRGVLTAFLIAVLLLLVQWPFQKLVFLFVNCSEEVRSLALKYFFIRVWAAPATLSLMAIRGWFIGMQDTFSSMLTDLIVNGVNILASIFLTLGIRGSGFEGIGYTGIAWGTLAAQYTGLLFASGVVLFKYSRLIRNPLSREVTESSTTDRSGIAELRQFFNVNRDLFIRSLCLMTVYLAFTAISARFGDVLLAMCSIMMKIMMVFSFFNDGFAFAGEALTGRFVGSKDVQSLRQTVKWTFIWSMGIGMLFIGIYLTSGIPMFRMMTSDAVVLESAREFIPWLILMPLAGSPAFTWDGIYTGATATKEMRDSNLGCVAAFFLVWFTGLFLLKPQGTALVHLLFAAYYSHLIYRSIYQTIKYRPAVLTSFD